MNTALPCDNKLEDPKFTKSLPFPVTVKKKSIHPLKLKSETTTRRQLLVWMKQKIIAKDSLEKPWSIITRLTKGLSCLGTSWLALYVSCYHWSFCGCGPTRGENSAAFKETLEQFLHLVKYCALTVQLFR